MKELVSFITSIDGLSLIMQYIVGFLLASVPALVWGYIFFKKDRDSRKSLLISFLGGICSVIPIMLYMNIWGNSISFLGQYLPHTNIFSFLQNLVGSKTITSFFQFSLINIAIAFGFFIIIALAILILRLIFIKDSRVALSSVIGRSFETPFQFIIIGFLVSITAFYLDFSINKAIWYFILVGAMEEYVKFLVLRFLDDGNYKGIDDVILQSVMIALGFAFFENIIYFVDKIWLANCSLSEIKTGICLQNPTTGIYIKQIGVLLLPFIFRSLFSTVAHVIFSAIFGYFYGLAYFRKLSSDIDESNENQVSIIWKLLNLGKQTLYWERTVIIGLILSMGIHALFNIILEMNAAYLIVPFLTGGYLLIDYFISIKHALKNEGLLDDDLKVAPTFSKLLRNIEVLKMFEDKLKNQVEILEKKRASEHLQEKVSALTKFEEQIRADERHKMEENLRKNSLYLNTRPGQEMPSLG